VDGLAGILSYTVSSLESAQRVRDFFFLSLDASVCPCLPDPNGFIALSYSGVWSILVFHWEPLIRQSLFGTVLLRRKRVS
jgi:hypothetical protein